MKDILLLTTVSLAMAFGISLFSQRENIADITLPEVQISAERPVPNIQLPAVTIRAAQPELPLPEVVITAERPRKA